MWPYCISEKQVQTTLLGSCAVLCASVIKAGEICNAYYIHGDICNVGYLTDLSKIKLVSSNGKIEVKFISAQNYDTKPITAGH